MERIALRLSGGPLGWMADIAGVGGDDLQQEFPIVDPFWRDESSPLADPCRTLRDSTNLAVGCKDRRYRLVTVRSGTM